MQNNCNSTGSPFSSAPPPSLTDSQPPTSSSASDFIPAGMLWPYSQLFSPPYFPTQAPPPTYPIPIYCPSKPPQLLDSNQLQFHPNSNLLRSSEHTNNNMTIQIGLQCLNDGSAKGISDVPSNGGQKKGSKAVSRMQQQQPQDELKSAPEDDEINSKLYEFTKLAIHGCDLAEQVTKNHKYRPCFKKIDSLCARLKQDISRPDGVLNNLNSQGMAWAVKDFIFVFTRIINAWLILKGYIYNQTEGMKKVRAAFSGNFQEGFFQWQDVTQQLIENIIESFENLDEAVQNSRTNRSVSGGPAAPPSHCGAHNKSANNGTRSGPSVDLSNFLWDNKEVTMRSSKKKSGGGPGEDKRHTSSPFHDSNSAATGTTTSSLSTPIYVEAERDEFETYYKTGLYQSIKSEGAAAAARKAPSDAIDEYSLDMEAHKENVEGVAIRSSSCRQPKNQVYVPEEMDLIDKLNLEDNIQKFEQETAANIQYLLGRIREIKETPYFFNYHFLKNYFPGFEKVIKELKDIRSIMMDAEQGKYKYVFAIVADLKMIIQSCKLYLNLNPNGHLMEVVANFERELVAVLAEKCFAKHAGLQLSTGY